jgi:hypothetical protein
MKARLMQLVAVAVIIAVPIAILSCAVLGIAVLAVRHDNGQLADHCSKKLNDTFLPFDNANAVRPYDKAAPAYAGPGPHPVTFLPTLIRPSAPPSPSPLRAEDTS